MRSQDHKLVRDSILKVGSVVSVQGRAIRVRVDKSKNVSHLLLYGEILKNISVGGYVKIRKGFETIIGKIEGEFISDRPTERAKPYINPQETFERLLEIRLFGFYEGEKFKKGTSEMPLIGNEAFLLDPIEYHDIHNFVADGEAGLAIGRLVNDNNMSIRVSVDSLFASHVGIFGNTGSGKSYTLASLYWRLFQHYGNSVNFKSNARFLLIDFNGEYTSDPSPLDLDNVVIDRNLKDVFKLSTRRESDKYPLELETINDELLWIITAEATEKTQAPFIRRSLHSRRVRAVFANDTELRNAVVDILLAITKSKNKELLPAALNVLKELELAFGSAQDGIRDAIDNLSRSLSFHSGTSEYYLNLNGIKIYANEREFENRLKQLLSHVNLRLFELGEFRLVFAKIVVNFYFEISAGHSNREHLSPVMKRLEKRVDDLEMVFEVATVANRSTKPMQIISLKDVNLHIRKILPLIVCKHVYEAKKLSGDRAHYLNIVVDEAHNILSDGSARESEQWKDYRLETFEEIIKEGRKFGVFLTISSQRPSDISPTILSQLHNYFLHRIVNEKDLLAIQSTISYLDRASFESLPILPTGACILTGQVSQVPVLVEIGAIPESAKPVSDTYRPSNHWND